MDSKLLLIKSAMLLYLESKLDDVKESSTELVKELVKSVKIPEGISDINTERDIVIGLRETILDLANNSAGKEIPRETLLQRIRVNTLGDSYLYKAIEDGLVETDDQDYLKKLIDSYHREIRAYGSKEKIKKMFSEAYGKLNFETEAIDWDSFVPEFMEKLVPYSNGIVDRDPMGRGGSLSLADLEKVAEVLEQGKVENSVEGTMATGWQGFNRMTGDHMGLRRGDLINIGALQHNYKSGTLLNIPRQIAMYNKPFMLDSNKKPLIIHLTFENKVTDNILMVYRDIYENMTGEPCDTSGVDPMAAAKYVHTHLFQNGYHFEMVAKNPTEFTIFDLIALIDYYEKLGYEIHLISIDYLNLMSKEGIPIQNESHRIRDLFRRLRNHCHPRGITALTAHQLSSEAKMLIRNGGATDDFVKEVADKGYWDSCKGLDQELDLEVIQHIVKPGDGFSYLTFQRGKHRRSGKITPEKDKFFVYRFDAIAAIPDDIHKADASRKRSGGGTNAEGGGAAWWDKN